MGYTYNRILKPKVFIPTKVFDVEKGHWVDIPKDKQHKGELEWFPLNKLCSNWVFKEGEDDEVAFAHYMGNIAEKNGLSANDIQHLFPYVLRMLKSDISWAQ